MVRWDKRSKSRRLAVESARWHLVVRARSVCVDILEAVDGSRTLGWGGKWARGPFFAV